MAGPGAGGEQPLLQSRDGGVLTLTLNRPHRRNAIDSPLWAAFGEALVTAADDPQVRALVITGAGGAFCAGLDLAGAGDGGHPLDVSGRGPGSHPLEEMRRANELALRLHDLPIPVVAKVTGAAVGAGWNLALGCDLVVASPQARFSQIFVHRGVSVDFGGSWLLPKLVGLQQAKRLVLLGETLDADEAHRLGLVTWVVADDEVDGFTADLARRLAAGPPVATAQSKALLNEGADRSLREALAGEARAQTVNFATADSREGFTAFLDKSEPVFTGEWAVK
ncbi:enoyl-CoA hydratase/isomerase family protein [Actinacidiphila bryophytorum]|uniref:Ring 1,2-epoxyphenylacetyl-CoA isomerase (Oxepin-CoA forming) n=1 Tax=Actinacidiphila bryophytorum TaxID=1436133 RepID=A0A9W4H3V5_9ACTN|nr:enoyl-CoA hydratase [Actinacidiphila bryophytorum]CAG7648092.1 putative ring 1,2-epoxyphenylacetyl-CoA isomerase (oxepin-CoA forming) [Actinacidiphila bryophytorum]